MDNTYLEYQSSRISDIGRKSILTKSKIKKTNTSKLVFQLKMWNLLNKLPLSIILHKFNKNCFYCKRSYAETIIDYYISKKIECKKCRFAAKFKYPLVSFIFQLISKGLGMPSDSFKKIIRENKPLKRLILNYMEGLGRYGLTIPQIPGGPIVTLWSITDKCNLRCKHCFVHQNQIKDEISFFDACKVINQLYEAKNFSLGFSGGEALLKKDIFKIMKYASDKGMHIALASNGTLITKEVAYKIKEAGVKYVQISIDGLEEVHNQIRGKGVFKKAIRGIKNCLEVGLYVSMDVVITKLNLNQLEDLIKLAKSLKVPKFEILDFIPSGKASKHANIALSPLEIEHLGLKLCRSWEKLIESDYPFSLSYKNPHFARIVSQNIPNLQLMPFFKGLFPKNALKFFNFSKRLSKGIHDDQSPFGPFMTGCEPGFYVIHIDPSLNINPCPFNPIYLGNLKKNHIKDIWDKSSVLNTYRKLKFDKKCGKCMYKIVCGGCRAKAYLAFNTHSAPDPSCILNCR
ncbi:MAG: radical SAM protein [Candidatus Lokiarchaeota archaeon]|nr:radical SAM protein [Candidatus Lokiarchaeota archaeon]